jgi:predicted metalloprotease with PDZ domain
LQLSYGNDSKMQPYIGVTLGDGLTLSRVARNSPAWQAGLDAGDELLALNGIKLTAEGFSKRLNDFQAGETITLTLFSNDTLVTRQVVLGQQASGKLQLQPVKGVSGRQKAFFKAWLGIDWPFDNKGNFKN